MKDIFQRLRFTHDGLTLYQAGLPHFPRNFTRDGILAALITQNAVMLKEQLIFCARQQGKQPNAKTGEEPGKIFHEFPGFPIDGYFTDYNGCDTTALYLIGHEAYWQLTDDATLQQEHRISIQAAARYILAHLRDGLFIESPAFCGAEKFALRVTYWKDSQIPYRSEGQPAYPVVYSLAHIQNLAGLRCAAKLLASANSLKHSAGVATTNDLTSAELSSAIQQMKEGLVRLYEEERGIFFIGQDEEGAIGGTTSDSLHALFYLEPDDLPRAWIEKIASVSAELETLAGYRTMDSATASSMGDKYHAHTLWPFEQAIINLGARKFQLDHVAEVSARVLSFLKSEPEILVLGDNGAIDNGGSDPQLWTVAAKEYFEKLELATTTQKTT